MTDRAPAADLIEESDRGCVLVGAAMLEEDLAALFKVVFQKNAIPGKVEKSLFDANGPLSTFSAKIKMAYGMGLIDRPVFDDLELIRRIRNEFAHSPAKVDFVDDRFKPLVESLNAIQDILNVMPTYGVAEGGTPDEYELRKAGYIKRTKALFSLGVKSLGVTLMRAQLHALGIPGPVPPAPALLPK
jgi:DNA-binding MltR family transcriptional regulator